MYKNQDQTTTLQKTCEPTLQRRSIPFDDKRPEAILQRHQMDCLKSNAANNSENSSMVTSSASSSEYVQWSENYQHAYDINGDGVIQGAFDKATITSDIVDHGTGIRRPDHGLTGEAFIITTGGEHRQIFIKFTDDSFAVDAARLAALFEVNTPRAISIDKADILEKVTAMNEGYGGVLNGKGHAIAFEFVDGTSVRYNSKNGFNNSSYRQIGAIAAFDMLIGKQDLFENYEQFNPDQENYHNVKVSGSNLIDIDLASSKMTPARLGVMKGIIAAPDEVHRFVQRKIGGLFELNDTLSLLKIQRAILVFVASVGGKAEQALAATDNANVRESIELIAGLSEGAGAAIAGVDHAIAAEEERVERIRLENERRMAARERERELARQRQEEERRRKAEEKCCGCCYLTTACCDYFGFSDDCEYLAVLRSFRDDWLLHQPGGEKLVEEYYRMAPPIVLAIEKRLDTDKIYHVIFKGITIAVEMIKNKEMEQAKKFYMNMSLSLKQKFAT